MKFQMQDIWSLVLNITTIISVINVWNYAYQNCSVYLFCLPASVIFVIISCTSLSSDLWYYTAMCYCAITFSITTFDPSPTTIITACAPTNFPLHHFVIYCSWTNQNTLVSYFCKVHSVVPWLCHQWCIIHSSDIEKV